MIIELSRQFFQKKKKKKKIGYANYPDTLVDFASIHPSRRAPSENQKK